MDKEVFLDCANHVAKQRCDPLPSPVADKAARLLRYMIEHENEFYDRKFAESLSSVAFVPVDRIAETFGDEATGPTNTILVSFREASVPKDRHLVWTVTPVIPPHLVPPQMMWSSIGIVTPPSIDTVLRHLRRLIDMTSGEAGAR